MRGKRADKNLEKELETQNPSPAISGPQESPFSDSQETKRRKPPRRRGLARKPYQDKLLNMAEARREIVTALKLHRASKKQGRDENHPGPETELLGPVSHHFSAEKEAAGLKSRRSPRIYASSYYVSNIANNAYPPTGLYNSRPVCSFEPPPFYPLENHLNLVLPSQTLGLNLNLQGFNNLDTSFLWSSANSSSSTIYNSSSPSASCSPPLSGGGGEEIAYMAGDPASEIRSVGDDDDQQHKIGVSDSRAEFLGPDEELGTEDFGVGLDFPAWVNVGDESCVTHHHLCGGAYFQDPAPLPCMDIEEIEGMDDWLA